MERTPRCAGNALMTAGIIVTTIGVALALAATLELPRHWTTTIVGVALFAAGALRWALLGSSRGGDTPRATPSDRGAA